MSWLLPFAASFAFLVMVIALVGVVAHIGIAIKVIFLAALAAAIRPCNIEAD